MSEPELPKKNTIGITFTEGFIRDKDFDHIIETVLGIPEHELFAIDGRGETRFIFKVTTEERYENICKNYLGKEIEIEPGFKFQVDDISANKTRVCITRVPFEVNNDMLQDMLKKYGKVHKCQDQFIKYGKYTELKGTGTRIAWITLNEQIPQSIDINQIKNNVLVKYPRQPSTCHKCGIAGHLARDCSTPVEQYQNALDINIELVNDSNDPNKKYACLKCSYKGSSEGNFKAHMNTHTGEKPHQCLSCTAKFQDQKELEEHNKIHAGHSGVNPVQQTHLVKVIPSLPLKHSEKILHCTVCEYKCKKKDDLENHLISHNEEKPYKCSKCDHKFALKANLEFHMKNHSEVTAIDLSFASILKSPVRQWTSSISSNVPPVLKLTALKKRSISTSPEGKPNTKHQATEEGHCKWD